ncbi:MAG: recombination regulator RecX [Gammaproteobacteria bacterium]|nr:recombination regulator RecX [Gammaproteobacteria bacterium]
MQKSVDLVTIHATALNLLARREHSRWELRYKLRKRYDAPDIIETVLDQLTEADWLSESRFVDVYIRSRANRGFGPVHIHQSLLQRGIKDELIQHYLYTLPDINWREQSEQVRIKKFGRALPTQYSDRIKQLKFLQYRGFGDFAFANEEELMVDDN